MATITLSDVEQNYICGTDDIELKDPSLGWLYVRSHDGARHEVLIIDTERATIGVASTPFSVRISDFMKMDPVPLLELAEVDSTTLLVTGSAYRGEVYNGGN